MEKLNTIIPLAELGNYLKNSFKFVLIESGINIQDIKWNIQYVDYVDIGNVFLEIVIVQDSFLFNNNDADLIISTLQQKFIISGEDFDVIETGAGEGYVITFVADNERKRYVLTQSKNIPSEFNDYNVFITIESDLRNSLPNARYVLTDEDLKKNETKIIEEISKHNRILNDKITRITKDNRPIIITEGKTDIQHIRNAKEKLNLNDIDVDFEQSEGDGNLSVILKRLAAMSSIRRIVIGIFDMDNKKMISDIKENNQKYIDYGNKVFAFCIPIPNNNYGENISIEHYYPEKILRKEDENGRRLFFGSEFYPSGNSIDGKYETKVSNIQNKININGIIDEKVYYRADLQHANSIALTKSAFAKLIESNSDFVEDFDYQSFILIFDRIREIIQKNRD